jgi:hypothetical protein
VSARHQVKRLDRPFEEFALSKTGPAEETSFLRSVRIPEIRNFTGILAQVKSGPDVFADALVPPRDALVPAGTDDARHPASLIPTNNRFRPIRLYCWGCFASPGERCTVSGTRGCLRQWLSFRETAG